MALTSAQSTAAQLVLAYLGRGTDVATLQSYAANFVNGMPTASQLSTLFASAEAQGVFGATPTLSSVIYKSFELIGRTPTTQQATDWVNYATSKNFSLAQLPWEILKAGLATESTYAANQQVLWARTALAYKYAEDVSANPTAVQALASSATAQANARALIAAATDVTTAQAIYNGTGTVTIAGSISNIGNQSGQTFTLTAGIDSKTGTSGADTFDGSLVSGVQTLGSSDNLNGGTGSDTLVATLNTASTISPTLTSIENIQVVDTAGATLNLQNATGVESIVATGSSRTTFSNIASTAVALEVSGNNQGANFTFTNAALAGTADQVTVKLNGVNDTVNAQINVAQAAGTDTTGAETVVINSTGSANRVAQVTSVNAATTNVLKTVKVTGDQALTVNTALGTVTTTVDASGQTTAGGVTATMTAGAAKFIGGAGADAMSFTTTAGDVSVTGGAGNDSFTFGGTTQTLTNADTIDGGEGTDTIVAVSADLAGYAKLATPTITNVEAVKVSNTLAGDLTLSNLGAGISTVELAAGVDNTQRVVTFASGANTVNLTGTTVIGTSGVKVAVAGNATTDSVTINADSTTAMFNAGEPLAVDGAETITINAKKVAEVIDGITLTNTMAAAQTVNFGGGFGVTAGTITATTGTIAAINASAMTVATTAAGLSATAGSATAMTGSGGRDALTGSSGKDTIDGGAGNDTIASGGGNDVISGGAGNDGITLNGAGTTASVDGGAGNDTITVSGNLAKTQTIGGGADTDILVINAADVTTFNALTTAEKAALKANITGIETLAFAADTGATLDVSTLVNTAEVTTYRFDAAQTSQVNNVASGSTLDLTTATSSFTATVKDASTATTDAITYKYTNAANTNFGTQTIANVETINVVSNDADAATDAAETHTAIISADSVVGGLNISGDNNLVLTVSGATKLATTKVTSTGTLNLDVSASTVANTITLGSGNSTVVAGIGADTITGGIGNDSIDAGSGNDIVTGGAGNDTINGGAGSDSLSGGSGNDVFLTSAGTDTIDGGDNTDTLKVSSGVFNNISSLNLTSVETLDMNSLATTMTVAQAAGFTTISNGSAGIVYSDAGTINANKAVTIYTLANGTNAFTTVTLDSGAYNITGGTGADTVNTTVGRFVAAGTSATFAGGTGSDILNFTDNTAVTVTTSNVSAVEKLVFANTDTAVAFTTGNGMVGAGETVEFDFSNLTSGTLNFNGSGETTGATAAFKILKGGTGNGTITGGSGADTILGGSGADTITGGAGNDSIDLSSGGNDTIVFNAMATNGTDLISGFAVGATADALKVSTNLAITVPGALTAGTTTGNTTLTDNMIITVNMAAAIASKAYDGADFADIFAAAAKVVNTTVGGSVQGVVVVQGTDVTKLVYVDSSVDTTNTDITATDVKVIGVLSDVTNASTFNIANFS